MRRRVGSLSDRLASLEARRAEEREEIENLAFSLMSHADLHAVAAVDPACSPPPELLSMIGRYRRSARALYRTPEGKERARRQTEAMRPIIEECRRRDRTQ